MAQRLHLEDLIKQVSLTKTGSLAKRGVLHHGPYQGCPAVFDFVAADVQTLSLTVTDTRDIVKRSVPYCMKKKTPYALT